jgi:hypothetical protein
MSQTCQFELANHSFFSRVRESQEVTLYHDQMCDVEPFFSKYSKYSGNRYYCGLPTVSNSCYCVCHKCDVDGCVNSIHEISDFGADYMSTHCRKHTCHISIIDSCVNVCLTSDFCDRHKCRLCSKAVYISRYGCGPIVYEYCEDHLTEINVRKMVVKI